MTKKELRDFRKQNEHLKEADFDLALACLENEIPKIKKALAGGADPNCRFHNGYIMDSTPLILVAHHANAEAMRLLLSNGANPRLCTKSQVGGAGDRDPLLELLSSAQDRSQRIELTRLLLANGADPNRADNAGRTPLTYGAYGSDIELMEVLVSAGAMLLPSSPEQASLSLDAGNIQCLEWFLQKGWPVDAYGANQRTRLLVAAENAKEEEIDFLIKRGANIRHRDAEGVNCLSYACRYATRTRLPEENKRALRVVQRLLAAGADINNKDDYGKTPLDYAKLARNPAVAALLKSIGAKTGSHVK